MPANSVQLNTGAEMPTVGLGTYADPDSLLDGSKQSYLCTNRGITI